MLLLASIPLGIKAISLGFGEGVVYLVPVVPAAIWLSLSTGTRSKRLGWFVIAFVTLTWLPSCWWWERAFTNLVTQSTLFTNFGDGLNAIGTLAFPIAVGFTVLPWLGLCASVLAARRWVPNNSSPAKPQFSLREFLCATIALCVATAWMSANYRTSVSRHQQSKERFYVTFTESFSVGLLANTSITEIPLRGFGIPSDFHLYRVTSAFERNGKTHWGAWDYGVNNDSLDAFTYTEAHAKSELAPFGTPTIPQRLSKPIGPLVNGVPQQSWPTVAVRDATCQDNVVSVTVAASPGTFCELNITPFHVTAGPPPTQIRVPKSGVLTLSFPLVPGFKGNAVSCDVVCRENSLFHPAKASCSVNIKP